MCGEGKREERRGGKGLKEGKGEKGNEEEGRKSREGKKARTPELTVWHSGYGLENDA